MYVYLQEHRKIQMFNGFAKRARCRTENACERDRITKTTEQHKIDCSSFANKKEKKNKIALIRLLNSLPFSLSCSMPRPS